MSKHTICIHYMYTYYEFSYNYGRFRWNVGFLPSIHFHFISSLYKWLPNNNLIFSSCCSLYDMFSSNFS